MVSVPGALRDELFHPAVRAWFERTFPEGPTEPQAQGWPAIQRGEHTLIAAPTGSGKTLAGFLVAIDALYRAADAGHDITSATQVVYVSPLKALAVDVHYNLEAPLAGIAEVAEELGSEPPPITLAVRSGDTPPSQRQAMVKRPPNFLITTPESLYLYLTAERSRATLRTVETVIVDEIHAMARDKRGSHLALTIERLEHVCERSPVRVGLSATQRPIETVARLLAGAAQPIPAVVDIGHRRRLDLSLEVPDGELEAALSGEQREEILDRIAAHVAEHRTTLIFVNTRRLSERLAHLLAERLGPVVGDDAVAAHHGSLSKDRRQRVEARLRAGELKALVATASLELGIDVGPVELVCQFGSPRNIATFLQRVGRANHHHSGVPRGILYPTTRDELVESAALLSAVHGGRLDALLPPVAPLDVLAQQVVAEVAARGDDGCGEDELYELVRRAAPYAELPREEFDEVVELVSEGIETGRGRRMAYLHRDRVHGRLRARRGARLAALTSGGAIPETGDYRVVMEPGDVFVGTVNEDFAIEAMQGDVFLLGTHPWRVLQVTNGEMRVADASGETPTVPFWLGEAPGRTAELSEEVSELRRLVGELLASGGRDAAEAWLVEHCGLTGPQGSLAAAMIVDYLAASRTALGGVLPTHDDVVLERFFDETGGMQLVVHAPFGARPNRALGLGLRKKFCVQFDFELQAAATDNAVLLSLGPQHSFPLEEVPRYLHPDGVRETVSQAVLASPMFTARWRWNLNRSLAVLRRRGGRVNPFNIQRMEADDLMVAVFPGLAQCQDNAPAGPVEVPDHLLVRETMRDCLHEAMDVAGLEALVRRFHEGTVRVHFVESVEPSPLAHEILNGAPYTFLDDAPLEERRSRAVALRRGLPVEARELGRLDPEAVERVREEAVPSVRDPDELHDLLLSLVLVRPDDPRLPAGVAEHYWPLATSGRAAEATIGGMTAWVATERRELVESEEGEVARVRGHLDVSGPVAVAELAELTLLSEGAVRSALEVLRSEGFAVAGEFDPRVPGEQWCARRLLSRIHAYTRARKRAEVQAVSEEEWLEFLERWWYAAPGTQRHGRAGVLDVIEQLQGFEWPAGDWERMLRQRVEHYRPEWLDDLCLSGEVAWGRLSLRAGDDPADPPRRGRATPSRATPITFMVREDVPWLLQAARGDIQPVEPVSGAARDILDTLAARGALFHSELQAETGRLPTEVEEGLWDGVARGLVTADGFNAVRSLLDARTRFARRQRRDRRVAARGRRGSWRHGVEGRWALFPRGRPVEHLDELAEQVADQLLLRWGVVFRDVSLKERLAVPWREILWALRRMEARGVIRGGRFVTGVSGEQYALPEAMDALRKGRRHEPVGARSLSL